MKASEHAIVESGNVDAFVAEAEFIPPVGGEFRVVSAESFNLAKAQGGVALRDAVMEVLDDWTEHPKQRARQRTAARLSLVEAAERGPSSLREYLLG